MTNIRLMKLAGLLTESAKKKKLSESISNPFEAIGRMDNWALSDLLDRNPANFKLSRDWKLIRLSKMPGMLGSEELEDAIADCDRNIKIAKSLLELSKKVKDQLNGLTASSQAIAKGEVDYENRQITAQHIADFLESIFITDKGNQQRIFDMYNASVKKNWGKRQSEIADELLLKRPTDLIGKARVRQGGKDIVFVFTREGGKPVSQWDLENSVLKLVQDDYPEVRPLLLVRQTTWSAIRKKEHIIAVNKSSIASNPENNRNWKKIFIKYAEWLAD